MESFKGSPLFFILLFIIDFEVARMKHIFDYAEEHKLPCVISYSIGFDYIPDDAELYREALQGVQGPGKIIVVSAGNSNADTCS